MKIKKFGVIEFKDDSASVKLSIKFDEKTSLKKAWDYYSDQIASRCHCDFDCCGHYFSSCRNVIRKGKNKFEFSLSYYRNF